MRIDEVIKNILDNPNKVFKAKNKPYILKISNTGGLSVIKTIGKHARTNTLDITGEHVLLEWEEMRKPVTAIEALKQTKRIKPVVGDYSFEDVENWLLGLTEIKNRHLLSGLWEIE